MLRRLLHTQNDIAPFIARITLGLVMLPHGLQKLLGIFGGHGFSATMSSFTSQGIPTIVAFMIIIGESFGALGLIFGFIGRFCAFGISTIMLGAIAMVHFRQGFFGFEFHLLALGLGLIVMLKGSGKWSLDHRLSK